MRLKPERIKELTLLLLIIAALVGVQPGRRQLHVRALLQPGDPGRRRDRRARRRTVARDHHPQHRPLGRIHRRGQRLPDRRGARQPPRHAAGRRRAARRGDRDAARLRQRRPRRLRADPLDHRHARHAGDLPHVADQLRRGAHDHGQLVAPVARRPPTIDGVHHRRVRVPHDVRAGDRRDPRAPGAAVSRPRRANPLRHRLQPRGRPPDRVCPCDARRSPPSRRAERSPASAGSSCSPASARSPYRPARARARVDRRCRRRRGQHARRLGDDRRQLLRRGADRPARPEHRCGCPRSASSCAMPCSGCSSCSPSCSTGCCHGGSCTGARSCPPRALAPN